VGTTTDRCPYEVRGGVAIHVSQLWPFIRAVQKLELDCFGCQLSLYKKEIKGSTLLDRKRFRFAAQGDRMLDEARRKHCRSFLTKGLEKKKPIRAEFTAYGQACLEMATGICQLLDDHKAMLIASAIPRNVAKEHGVLVMDEVEKTEDRRFVRRMERYFTKTDNGRYRTTWIVPTPFFVSSDMTYAVQAADLCIYCVNWGFRLDAIGMNAPKRDEIADTFGVWLSRLQYRGQGHRGGQVFSTFGIVYVPDPYSAR